MFTAVRFGNTVLIIYIFEPNRLSLDTQMDMLLYMILKYNHGNNKYRYNCIHISMNIIKTRHCRDTKQ